MGNDTSGRGIGAKQRAATRDTYRRRTVLKGATTGATIGALSVAGCLGGGNGGPVLRVINSAYQQQEDEYRAIFDEFEEEHDCEVEYTRSDFASAPSEAAQAQAGGNPYDLLMLASPGNNVFGVQEGLYQPINDVIEDMGAEDHWREEFLVQIDGDYYFAPNTGTVSTLIYREDLFNEYDAPMPPFDSWDEYHTAAETMTDEDENLYGSPVFLGSNHFHGILPLSLLHGRGGSIINTDDEVVYDSEETVEMLEFMRDLNEFSPQAAHGADIPEMRPPLYQGTYAMTWYSTNVIPYDIEQYNPDLTGDVQVAPIPAYDSSYEPVARLTGLGHGLGAETEHPELAKDLLREITSFEGVMRLMTAQPASHVPAIHGILEEDDLWETDVMQDYEEHYRDLVDIADEYGRVVAVEENEGHINPVTGQAVAETHVISSVQDVILEDEDPQDAAEHWADEIRDDYADQLND
ncbi:ABC transporter substrate-binding protein [Natrialba chahannaoensis]|uniref:ABC transporter substrate-binding protein n=1 Tax=Natrialba chahannaoensis TaxID=68911 RepID=UPI000677DAED|nr:extracellular solute-binding protein [Natrialba chahannaoensis]